MHRRSEIKFDAVPFRLAAHVARATDLERVGRAVNVRVRVWVGAIAEGPQVISISTGGEVLAFVFWKMWGRTRKGDAIEVSEHYETWLLR